MIIVFEGLDKLGKTTQAIMLWEHFNKKGYNVKYFKQPDNRGDSLQGKLKNLISNSGMKLSPMAEWALHLASHANQWHYSILPALRKKAVVILDRCWLSALVYQGVGKGLPPEVIIRAEQEACKNAKFDEVFVFYSAVRNPLKKDFDSHSMEQQLKESEDLREKISHGYFQLCQEFGYTLVDVEKYKGDAEGLHKFIVGLLSEKMKKRRVKK